MHPIARAARVALVLGVATVLAAITAYWSAVAPPRQTTVREILADPTSFDNAIVTLSTTVFENGPDSSTLIYRRAANRPPLVVVELARPYSDRRPTTVTGRVKVGTSIVIADCRPVP